jgi:hypothetical protein
MIRHISAVAVAAVLLDASLAQAQVLEYSVQTYAPLPRYGPANSPHEWFPRGILPDGTLVVNTFWQPSVPDTENSAIALISPASATRLAGSDGTPLLWARASAVEAGGVIHVQGRLPNSSESSHTWRDGEFGTQQAALGISQHDVIDVSAAGHVLATNFLEYPFRSQVRLQGLSTQVPFMGDSPFFNWPRAINNTGTVVGGFTLGSEFFGYTANGSTVTVLDFPVAFDSPWVFGSFGMSDINDAGWAAGLFAFSNQTASLAQTVLWRESERILLPARALTPFEPQLDNLGTLLSADDTSPYLWRDGQLVRMTDLALPSFAGTLVSLDRLEPDGRVIGQAILDGQRVAVVLTPVPGPGGTVLGAIGLLIAARRARR